MRPVGRVQHAYQGTLHNKLERRARDLLWHKYRNKSALECNKVYRLSMVQVKVGKVVLHLCHTRVIIRWPWCYPSRRSGSSLTNPWFQDTIAISSISQSHPCLFDGSLHSTWDGDDKMRVYAYKRNSTF